MIPKEIYFCHKTKCLMKNYPYNWKKLNDSFNINLFDDKSCSKFLKDNFGKKFVDIFNFLKNGAIKADFWRICILFKNGGFYCDVDNEPLVPINDFLEKNIDFITCCSFSPKFKFNPNFIGSTKYNPILKECIDWYIEKYDKKIPFEFWEYSIMTAFNEILELKYFKKKYGIYQKDNLLVQIIEEHLGKNHYDAHNIYKNKRIFNNRYQEWDCVSRSFNREKKFFEITKGTNLNYYLLNLYKLLFNLFTIRKETQIIVFDNAKDTMKSLFLFGFDFIMLNSQNKIISVYNYLLRSNSKYYLIVNSNSIFIKDLSNLIAKWLDDYGEETIIFEDIDTNLRRLNSKAIIFLESTNILISRKNLIKLLNKAIYYQKVKSSNNINHLLDNNFKYVINKKLFITLILGNENNIIKYQKEFKKIINLYNEVLIKLSFIISILLICIFT